MLWFNILISSTWRTHEATISNVITLKMVSLGFKAILNACLMRIIYTLWVHVIYWLYTWNVMMGVVKLLQVYLYATGLTYKCICYGNYCLETFGCVHMCSCVCVCVCVCVWCVCGQGGLATHTIQHSCSILQQCSPHYCAGSVSLSTPHMLSSSNHHN